MWNRTRPGPSPSACHPPECLTLPRAPNAVWSPPVLISVGIYSVLTAWAGGAPLQRDVSLVFFFCSFLFYMAPWVHVSSQITSFMCFILEKQTDYDCTDVATVKVPLITYCTVVSATLLECFIFLFKSITPNAPAFFIFPLLLFLQLHKNLSNYKDGTCGHTFIHTQTHTRT